jgi:hypothetical protein
MTRYDKLYLSILAIFGSICAYIFITLNLVFLQEKAVYISIVLLVTTMLIIWFKNSHKTVNAILKPHHQLKSLEDKIFKMELIQSLLVKSGKSSNTYE